MNRNLLEFWRDRSRNPRLPCTAIIRCWGTGREVEILGVDDCNVATLRNLRTGSQWKMTAYTGARCPNAERRARDEMMANGTKFYGALLGPEEWYGWDGSIRLCRIHRYRKIGGFVRHIERTGNVPKIH